MEPSITDAAWWSDLADKLAAAETACRFRGGYSEAEIAALRSAQNTTRLLSMELRDDEPDERQRLSDTVDRVLRQRAPKGEG